MNSQTRPKANSKLRPTAVKARPDSTVHEVNPRSRSTPNSPVVPVNHTQVTSALPSITRPHSGSTGLAVGPLPRSAKSSRLRPSASPRPPLAHKSKLQPEEESSSFHFVIDQSATRGESQPDNENSMNLPHQSGPVPAPRSRGPTSGMFNNSHHLILNNPTFIDVVHPNEKDAIGILAQNIIPGAQFDSGERYPPPSCHPGTRLDISEKLVSWMRDLARACRIMWLHGPAGVGKSAIIQTLAESEANSPTSILGATIFFSKSNERDDPQCVIITIAYQLAVRYPAYRTYVAELLSLDPLVVTKSLVEQFKWFILMPFAEKKLLEGSHHAVLVTLDGLDECNGELAQREIISLVCKFSLQHPTTPLIWIIASRPEPQIRTAFSHRDVTGAFLEMEVPVDSDQACADVEHYLRDKFSEIKENHSTSFSLTQQWPTERDFTKIAKRSSGLFAFANTVVRFTDDVEAANPIAQLQKVLDVLGSVLSPPLEDAPFAALDALYTLILSAISPKVLLTTRKLLMVKGFNTLSEASNILSINQADTYGALRKLYSVLDIPPPGETSMRNIRTFHKSFDDYLESPSRSGSFCMDTVETRRVKLSAYTRILLETHDVAKSIVRTSSINVSWPERDVIVQRQRLFFPSLLFVLRARPDEIDRFDKLHSFFQDIDYASFGSLFAFPELMPRIVGKYFTSPLHIHLKEWGVFSTVQIRVLDLDYLSPDDPMYIFSSKPSPPSEESESKWERAYLPANLERGAFASDLQAGMTDYWYRKITTLQDEPYWRAHIHQQFTDLSPSYTVTMLGKGNKSCIVAGTHKLNRSWVYILPYRP